MALIGGILCGVVAADPGKSILDMLLLVNNGGEFFSHAVFSALVSVAISSRLRDFIIAPTGDGIGELKRDIEQEISKVRRSTHIDDNLKEKLSAHYENCKDDTTTLLDTLNKDVASIEQGCRIWCYVAILINILLIALGWNKCIGALNLLCLLPLLIARVRMGNVYKEINSRLNDLQRAFTDVRRICQSQYDQEQANTDKYIKELSSRASAKSSKRVSKSNSSAAGAL